MTKRPYCRCPKGEIEGADGLIRCKWCSEIVANWLGARDRASGWFRFKPLFP